MISVNGLLFSKLQDSYVDNGFIFLMVFAPVVMVAVGMKLCNGRVFCLKFDGEGRSETFLRGDKVEVKERYCDEDVQQGTVGIVIKNKPERCWVKYGEPIAIRVKLSDLEFADRRAVGKVKDFKP